MLTPTDISFQVLLQRRRPGSLDGRQTNNVYISTYKKDFTGEIAPPAGGARPRSSGIYTKGVKMERTLYEEEFQAKPVRRTDAIRTGSSSGSRRNNPHPLQPFLVWRFNSNGFNKIKQRHGRPADRKLLENVLSNQMKTTYQVDYTDLQQDVQKKSFHNVDWKPRRGHSPRYSFTTARHAFRPPRLWPQLTQKGGFP